MTKGGKRENSGRKRSKNKKIRMSCSLAPDVIDYLNRRNDKPKAQVIEDALRFYEKIYADVEKYGNLAIYAETGYARIGLDGFVTYPYKDFYK